MIYAVREANGQYTGATYLTRTAGIMAHHAAFDQRVVPVIGLLFTGTHWEPAKLELPDARDVAMQKLMDWVLGFLSGFTDGVPEQEIASWSTKAMAATAHLAGKPQDIIIGEATLTGEKPDDLARIINGKAQLYTAIIARMTGLRRMATRAIAEAKTPEDVAAALDDALATAHHILADLGLTQET